MKKTTQTKNHYSAFERACKTSACFEGKFYCIWCLWWVAGIIGMVAKWPGIKEFALKRNCCIEGKKKEKLA
ncbi:hypothetical protein FJZ26_02010 [Candidatus Parvarchaeota archaeon]|nr:hypothetical protein [Candidatus Parvarchaeota archaeon]